MRTEDCRDCRELLSPFIEGELGEAEARRLARHLEECPPCRRALEELRRTVNALHLLPQEPPPPEILRAVRAVIRRPSLWARWESWTLAWWPRALVQAAAVVLVALSAVLLQQRYPTLREEAARVTKPASPAPLDKVYRSPAGGKAGVTPPAEALRRKESAGPNERPAAAPTMPGGRHELSGKPLAAPAPRSNEQAPAGPAPTLQAEEPSRQPVVPAQPSPGAESKITPSGAAGYGEIAPAREKAPFPPPLDEGKGMALRKSIAAGEAREAPVAPPLNQEYAQPAVTGVASAPAPPPPVAPAKRDSSLLAGKPSAELAPYLQQQAPADLQAGVSSAETAVIQAEPPPLPTPRAAKSLAVAREEKNAADNRLLVKDRERERADLMMKKTERVGAEALPAAVASTTGADLVLYLGAPAGYDWLPGLRDEANRLGGRVDAVGPAEPAIRHALRDLAGKADGTEIAGTTVTISLPAEAREELLRFIRERTSLSLLKREGPEPGPAPGRRAVIFLHIR